ncbi:hypothetical protein [Streptomyces sp. NPDC096033]|uniref:hypothetical protein n=1 Tax=Streptomyces sp. NPDC096033 TaxID=3366071 RepID=UPI003800BC0D
MKLPAFLTRFRRPAAEPVIDLTTPEARREYTQALAAKDREFRARGTVDFSRPAPQPYVRRRGGADPAPTFRIVPKASPPAPKPSPAVPDVWGP